MRKLLSVAFEEDAPISREVDLLLAPAPPIEEIRQAMDYGRKVLMWEPGLEHQQWARKLADSGEAAFITDANDVRLAIKEIDL